MHSWLPIPAESDFSIHNLPYGIFHYGDGQARAGMAIGDHIIDLVKAAEAGLLGKRRFFIKIFAQSTLNEFIGLGKPVTNRVRRKVQEWLCLASRPDNAEQILTGRRSATMLLPVRVGNYTDFYSSIEHATNVGKMFRPDNPLLPNWRWLPVGYHGRASSVVVSGTPIRRPSGQILPKDQEIPVFSPSRQLDFELEMAFVIGKESTLGEPILADKADEYIFGLLLFNDWSARDIQRWEYVPLGPFLGKNFGSSVSPWIVPLEALKPYRVKGPKQTPPPLDYLKTTGSTNYDIELEVALRPAGKPAEETVICRSNTRYLYWSMAQQLAHHTVNGCNVQVGDLMASGTISGPTPNSYGSMLELSWGGKQSISLRDGSSRTFLLDGDTIIMRGRAGADGKRIGFGAVEGTIV